jgi:hypothetical protein
MSSTFPLEPPAMLGGGGDQQDQSLLSRRLKNEFLKWQRKIPMLKRVAELFLRIPPKVRTGFIFFWCCWKLVAVLVVVVLFSSGTGTENSSTGSGSGIRAFSKPLPATTTRTRVLYIITTLAEYNSGTRATVRGQDRLGEVLIPILVDSVENMIAPPFDYHVDVFIILGYPLKPEREQFIRDSLPLGVGLQVWDDSSPLGYDKKNGKKKLIPNTRTLARQHRYVIKDKFFDYDLFLAFEDDMRLTGHHVQHFLDMSDELDRLRKMAPKTLPDAPENMDDVQKMKFYGQMTQQQMARLIPGMIRVEVLLNETLDGAQQSLAPVPLDYEFEAAATAIINAADGENKMEERHVDPSICCHVNMKPNLATPIHPKASDLVIWETNVKAFTLRQMPPESNMLDWAVVMLGPGKNLDKRDLLGGYWSGREGAFGSEERPSGGSPEMLAQQGGWMATRDQIARLNSGLCMGTFLPPFDNPIYNLDGQESMNVEFWSGGYQFFTGVRGGCNMQRLISMHPDHFSKHLIYHVANNKQRQLARQRMLRADHLFGQLNTVRKQAIKAKTAIEAKR